MTAASFKALAGRIRGMVARAVVTGANDEAGVQELQADVLADETLDALEHFQAYGFTSVPLPDAEAVVLFVAGTRSHGVVIATADRRYRVKGLQPGEVAIHDDQGQYVLLGRAGITVMTEQKVEIVAETVEVNASSVTVTADSVAIGGAGGQAVARVGDDVNLSTGKIVSGSAKVTAA